MKYFEMAFQIHTAMSGNMNTYAVQLTRALKSNAQVHQPNYSSASNEASTTF